MGAKDLASVTVERKAPGFLGGDRRGPTVVWMRGEHDVSNATRLSQVIAETIATDDEDVIVDLSGVEFMSGGTAAIFLRASTLLTSRERALILRAPRHDALRILALCGLEHLVQSEPSDSVQAAAAEALRTWVAVPVAPKGQEVLPASGDAAPSDQEAEAAKRPMVVPVDAE